jgi:hypothetical protein
MKKYKYVIVQNLNNPSMPPLVADYCSSFMCRLVGLMFHAPLKPGNCRMLVYGRDSRVDAAIHMFFMRTDLAVAWVNHAGEVVDVQLAKRWRPAYAPQRPARYVMEMAPERLSDFKIGDKVRFDEAWVDR